MNIRTHITFLTQYYRRPTLEYYVRAYAEPHMAYDYTVNTHTNAYGYVYSYPQIVVKSAHKVYIWR